MKNYGILIKKVCNDKDLNPQLYILEHLTTVAFQHVLREFSYKLINRALPGHTTSFQCRYDVARCR